MSEDSTPVPELTVRQILGELGSVIVRILCFAVVLGNIAMFGKSMLFNAYTPDFPWLLRGGEYILTHRQLPTHDVFSWTFPHKPWVLYQWLFEVLIAPLHHLLGEQGLFRLFSVSMAGLYLLLPLWVGMKRKMPWFFTFMVATSALFMASVNLSLRPMVVTTLFLAVQYLVILGYRRQKLSFKPVLASIGLIYMMWGNMHTGVILGLFSLGLLALGDMLERRFWSSPQARNEGSPLTLQKSLLVIPVALLASFINPYGVHIYAYLFNLSGQGFLNDAIVELQSPNFHVMNYWYFAVLLVVFILLMMKPRRYFLPAEILHLLVFTVATLFVQRFVVWTALFYALMLPPALHAWWRDAAMTYPLLKTTVLDFDVRYKKLILGIMAVASAIFLLMAPVLPDKFVRVRLGGCESLMKGIKAYQRQQKPGDVVFTEPEIGSCTLSANPSAKVFVDTRFDFYGQEFTKAGRDVLNLSSQWRQAFQRWGINTVVITNRWPLAQMLLMHPDYRKVYDDHTVLVFRKTSPVEAP